MLAILDTDALSELRLPSPLVGSPTSRWTI